jgi:hypothetical protein
MGAKETVMTTEKQKELNQEILKKHGIKLGIPPEPLAYGEGIAIIEEQNKARLEAQAEISFKAGQDSRLKEVKEWFESHGYLHLLEQYVGVGVWQAFLKGLEGDK